MKNLWTFFVMGLFGAAVLSVVMNDTKASDAKDPRVQKIEDSAISGLKTEVPLTKEMEGGLSEREAQIKERERRVQESEERLAVEETRVRERIDELQRLLDELDRRRLENRKTSEAVLAKLVKTFETMAPKKASGVIATMQDDLAVELLMAMKEARVAGVLEVMDPNRAMTLSSSIARRRPAGKAIGEEQAQPLKKGLP